MWALTWMQIVEVDSMAKVSSPVLRFLDGGSPSWSRLSESALMDSRTCVAMGL